MLTKTAQRSDDTGIHQLKKKFMPYQENNLQRFDHIINSTKSEGRAQKNLQHFRQLSKNGKRSGGEPEAVNPKVNDDVEPRKLASEGANQEVDTTKSTAA